MLTATVAEMVSILQAKQATCIITKSALGFDILFSIYKNGMVTFGIVETDTVNHLTPFYLPESILQATEQLLIYLIPQDLVILENVFGPEIETTIMAIVNSSTEELRSTQQKNILKVPAIVIDGGQH